MLTKNNNDYNKMFQYFIFIRLSHTKLLLFWH